MSWINEKLTMTLTRKEFSEMGNVFAEAQYNDVDFLRIKDRKIRKIFADTIKKRHKLWLKIQRVIR